ncbi:unnamed protein product, partial [Heterobilharzia americana]
MSVVARVTLVPSTSVLKLTRPLTHKLNWHMLIEKPEDFECIPWVNSATGIYGILNKSSICYTINHCYVVWPLTMHGIYG